MLGVYSEKSETVNEWIGYLETQAVRGMNHPHGDGFGVTYFENGMLHVRHEVNPVWARAATISSNERGNIILMHARKTSKGTTSLENIQPFYARSEDYQFVFCHNGTVYDINEFCSCDEELAAGKSDSAILFDRLIGSLPFFDDLPTCMMNLMSDVEERCRKITSLNCLFSNGESLGAIRKCFGNEEYYTLYVGKSELTTVVSTEPFGTFEWQLLPNHTLWILSHGKEMRFDLPSPI
jgi:glutamine amidotransferase